MGKSVDAPLKFLIYFIGSNTVIKLSISHALFLICSGPKQIGNFVRGGCYLLTHKIP